MLNVKYLEARKKSIVVQASKMRTKRLKKKYKIKYKINIDWMIVSAKKRAKVQCHSLCIFKVTSI